MRELLPVVALLIHQHCSFVRQREVSPAKAVGQAKDAANFLIIRTALAFFRIGLERLVDHEEKESKSPFWQN